MQLVALGIQLLLLLMAPGLYGIVLFFGLGTLMFIMSRFVYI